MFASPSARSRAVLYRLGAALAAAVPPAAALAAEPSVQYDEISVTATRDARPTKDVPLAISVIGKDRIDDEKMSNIKEAIQGSAGVQIDSNNGGYDVRLIIRGAGVNAQYGVREIMVLRDGVPVTDPNSFTTFDWIDPQDIERIEVVKGPGSVFATGSAGGTIQILSKSVFDDSANVARIGFGNNYTQNYHMRAGGKIDESQALAINLTRRYSDPMWRRQNRFEDNQGSLKYGRIDDAGGQLEAEFSMTDARMNLPGTMNLIQFNQYRATGKQPGQSNAFIFSERDSQVQSSNIRYERDMGDFVFKPRAYFTHWSQFHPVTGAINVSDQNYVFGTDLEANAKHTLFGLNSNLVTGIALRGDMYLNAKKYKYRDVSKAGTRITSTLSDSLGDWMETDDTKNYLAGVFFEENVGLTDRLNLDVGGRYDVSFLDLKQQQATTYNYSTGAYAAGTGLKYTQPTYNLYSPKAGLSYKITPELTTYASAAMADQVPAASQILTNFGLTPSHATNYEIGIKHRSKDWTLDAATYYSLIRNDIVSAVSAGQTVYQNAGKTEKKGFELGAGYWVLESLRLGGSYTYTDYRYLKFTENTSTLTLSRDGNRLPSIPINMYSLFAEYKSDFGLRARIQTMTMGDYNMDNASTMKYGGYSFVTNAMVGYEFDRHTIALNIDNLFDQRYSVDAKKDTSGNQTYAAGAPFGFLLSYALKY
jgi:iron complex outermembrane receptor protein